MCPKGDKEKYNIEDEQSSSDEEILTKEEEDKIEKQKRILKEVCKRVLFPLLSLLSRSFQKLDFKDMLSDIETKEIINSILKDKKIILNKNSYNSIMKIIDNNNEIINNIQIFMDGKCLQFNTDAFYNLEKKEYCNLQFWYDKNYTFAPIKK